MKKSTIALITITSLLIVATITGIYSFNKKELPVYGENGHKTGKFLLFNQEGKKVTELDVANKIRVVEFFFTTCKSICPKMNSNMQRVHKEFFNDPDIIILSHTVDPNTDNIFKLRGYADSLGVKPAKWLFLTGEKKEIYEAARFQYLVSAGESSSVSVEDDFIHTEKFVLIDKNNKIRGFYNGTDLMEIEKLIADIKQLK